MEIAPDLIAIVVEDDPELRLGQIPMLFNVERGDEFEAFAQEDVYFIRAEDAVSRDDMSLYQFDLREQDGVAQTGQVLYLPDAEMPIVMTDEFIVRFKDGVSVDDVDALTNDLAAEIIRQNEFVENQYLMRFSGIKCNGFGCGELIESRMILLNLLTPISSFMLKIE